MTAVTVAVPTGLALPDHLRTPEAAAQIAAANAAAAGGIKVGGFPKISIEGGKFHEVDASVDGGNPRTYMVAAQPGQPPLPMMCLEAVIIAANPALIKTFYVKKWQKGDAEAPDCQSSNGVTPDSSVAQPQSPVCATCPQNQWGSKVSEASGKDVKACSDSKQMVILPSADLKYKALGLAVTPAALGEWGKYVGALSQRNIPVNSVVTNITFDHTASFPKLQFAFNRFLTAEEYALAVERANGDDVKLIVSPMRAAPAQAALPAPAAPAPAPAAPVQAPAPFVPPPAQPAPAPQPVVFDAFAGHPPHVKTAVDALGGIASAAGASMFTTLTGLPVPVAPVAAPAAPAAPAAATAGFGAPAGTPAAAPAPDAAPAAAGRKRRSRAEIDADNAAKAAAAGTGQVAAAPAQDLSHLPPAILAAVNAVGVDSPAGQAMLAQFPRAATPAPAAAPAAPATPAPAPTPAPAAPAAAPGGFGATAAANPAPPASTSPAARTTGSAASLKDILQKKLGLGAAAAAPVA